MKEVLNLQSDLLISIKLEGIGLNFDEYTKAQAALVNFDVKTLFELVRASEIINKKQKDCLHNISTKDLYTNENGEYTKDRLKFHDQIINSRLEGLTSVSNPEMLFIVGPSGAGKTTLRNRLLEVNPNFAYTGLDDLRKDVLPIFDPGNLDHISRTQAEVSDISTKILDKTIQNKMNVITESTLRKSDWIENTLLNTKGYKTQMILIHTPLDQCFRRTIELRDRPSSLNFIINSFDSYNNFFTMLGKNEIDVYKIIDGMANANFDTIFKIGDGEFFINDKKIIALEKYLNNFSELNDKKANNFYQSVSV